MLMYLLFIACQNNKKKQGAEIDETTFPIKEYSDEPTCEPDTIDYPVKNERLFEDILDIYITQEGLNGKKDFLMVSSKCWSDSTYIVILSHYKWNNPTDSLVYLESDKESTYRELSVYLDIVGTSQLPIPNQLVVKNKKVQKSQDEPLLPFNEYFNDIQLVYYPKENYLLRVSGNERFPDLYEKQFRSKGILK